MLSPDRLRPRRLSGPMLLALTALLVTAATAGATVTAPPVAGHFAFHGANDADMRCHYGIGVEFRPVSSVPNYSVQYFDGYYNSEDFNFTESAKEFAAAEFSTPTSYFHGITGGAGPQPCSGDTSRFPKPPYIEPIYPDGKTPPLAKSHSSSSPSGIATATLRVASGTFRAPLSPKPPYPIGSSPSIELAVKPSTTLYSVLATLKVGNHAIAPVGALGSLSSSYLVPHKTAVATTPITATRAGLVKITATVTAVTAKGKKVHFRATSAMRFGALKFG